jgi:hypothetical protein
MTAISSDEAEEGTTERIKVEWVVKAKRGIKVRLKVKYK